MKSPTPFSCKDITLTLSPITSDNDSVVGDMPNPERVSTSRLCMTFSAMNQYVMDNYLSSEERENEFVVQFSAPATGYHTDGSNETFIRSVITYITACQTAFDHEQASLTVDNPSHARQFLGNHTPNHYQDVSNVMLAKFIELVSPERSTFSTSELDLIDDYRLICYHTMKWLYCAISGDDFTTMVGNDGSVYDASNVPLFDCVDDVLAVLHNQL